MASTLGAANPLRYRGYVYDTETGLYYLQTRYYDPGLCRFICGDAYVSTGQGIIGNNMFAYCLNNPVIYVDFEGLDAILIVDEDGALGFGHVILLLQADNGDWHYFSYYSAESIFKTTWYAFSSVACTLDTKLLGSSEGYDLSNVDGVRDFLCADEKAKNTAEGADYIYYVKGDFSEAKVFDEQYKPQNYSLIKNNCMLWALDVLLQCEDSLSQKQLDAIDEIKNGSFIYAAPRFNKKRFGRIGELLK